LFRSNIMDFGKARLWGKKVELKTRINVSEVFSRCRELPVRDKL